GCVSSYLFHPYLRGLTECPSGGSTPPAPSSLSLHDALPICNPDFDMFQLSPEHEELRAAIRDLSEKQIAPHAKEVDEEARFPQRSEEHTSELQSRFELVCRRLLERKTI